MIVNLDLVREVPSVLTAVRDFHRLRIRGSRLGGLTHHEVRKLITIRNLFEPRVEHADDRLQLMIAARRPVVIRSRHRSFPGVLVGLTLRTVHVLFDPELVPGEWLRIAIPRSFDRRWHRFHGRVVRVDAAARRTSIALVAPAGMLPPGCSGEKCSHRRTRS